MTLPQDLHTRCREILHRCSEFDSYLALQAIFVTAELKIYRNGLPQAPNREEQVSQTIAYLVEQRLSGNRPVFPLFLVALRNRRYEGDALRDELAQLYTEVEGELKQLDYIDIPFVIITMTHQEATELINETIFEHPDVAPAEREKFQQLKAAFAEDDLARWLAHYADEREGWTPHTHPQATIRDLILDAVAPKPDAQTGLNGALIRPQFRSTEFLAEDFKTRIDTWDHLSKSGCVLIVDAISLFHPHIYRLLLQSEMSANPQVALALLILATEANQANALIEQEIKTRLQRAFARFDQFDDKLCQLDVARRRALRRWLVATLPDVTQKIRLTPHQTGRQMMQQKVSQTHGMGNIISGQGW